MGASVAFAINRGVNRGLFSNEAGQGSAPIAHSAARAPEPVSEGMVAILEPFIDTIIICMLTGMVVLSSGVWTEKIENQFQTADMIFLDGTYDEENPEQKQLLMGFIKDKKELPLFSGSIEVSQGKLMTPVTLICSRSVAEDFTFYSNKDLFTGIIDVEKGKWQPTTTSLTVTGKSLIHSAPLTTIAFERSILGKWGKYIVSIGILLFAFSTAISWSYYGDRAVTYLVGPKFVIWYRIIFVVAFFIASFTDTTIIWSLSYITIAFMTVPNLIGLWILRKEIKATIAQYWVDFSAKYPQDRMSKKFLKNGRL